MGRGHLLGNLRLTSGGSGLELLQCLSEFVRAGLSTHELGGRVLRDGRLSGG